jgi:hypothetical protein
MKNSKILFVFGILGLGGVGAYIYLKGKKTPTLGSVADDTLGLTPKDDTKLLSDLGVKVEEPKDDTKLLADLGVKVEEPKATPYVKPIEGVPLLTAENLQKALLALGIDQTRSITELSSPNYIQAKKLASDIQYLSSYKLKYTPPNFRYTQQYTYSEIQMLSRYYGSTVPNSRYSCAGAKGGGVDDCMYKSGVSKEDVIKSMTQKLNALGYKLLPNFDIEKM